MAGSSVTFAKRVSWKKVLAVRFAKKGNRRSYKSRNKRSRRSPPVYRGG